MEDLEIMVNTIYDNKSTYKEIDYIVIMNVLKEAYLKLTNQLPIIDIKEDLCESCMGDDIYDDGLCIECLDIREDDAAEPYYVSDDEQDEQDC
jgi:hypothetical protein